MKRIVVPGYPHHIVQRGVRSLDIFFKGQDKIEYFNFLNEQSGRFRLTILAYCLMTNHVHLLAVPEKEDSPAKAVGEAHRQYTRMINFRENLRGFLFQGRFSSCPVYTDQYLFTALRYIEQNPVKAKIVKYPWQYKWSSASFHCGETSHDPLVRENRLFSEITDWKAFLSSTDQNEPILEERIRTGRPFGPGNFYSIIEKFTGRNFRPGLPGRPKKKLYYVPGIPRRLRLSQRKKG
ncbi:transposase [Desulfospira joergensenii]|uniref:transposase n=1 Tax=Desulfospira joergensenii TaxID=53329 RepID=UPI001ABF7C3B|nr:transposase [Desulfospira joergensenii]